MGPTRDLKLNKSKFFESQDVHWETVKNVPRYWPKQHFLTLKQNQKQIIHQLGTTTLY